MDLVQSRIVTGDVGRLAAFCARLVRVSVVLNEYYVEVPAAAASAGFSRRCRPQHQAEIMLDFRAGDVDAGYQRISRLGVTWVMPPATQPWGCRTMIFRDPAGNLVNVSSPAGAAPG